MSLKARLSSLLQRDVTYSVMSQVFVSGFNFAVGIAARACSALPISASSR